MPIRNCRQSLRGARREAAAAATAATGSQELWTSGGALLQRAQEQNVPCGEALASTKHTSAADSEYPTLKTN